MTRAKRPIVLAQFGNRFRIVGVLPPILYNVDYLAVLAAYGAQGTVHWELTGDLPTGIYPGIPMPGQRSNGTMSIYGKSVMYGDYPITISATDLARRRASRDFVLKVMRFPMPSYYTNEDSSKVYVSTPSNKPYISE